MPWKRQRPFKLSQAHIDNYHDPNVRTRRYAFRRVNSAIGVVAIKAADELRRYPLTTTTSNPHTTGTP